MIEIAWDRLKIVRRHWRQLIPAGSLQPLKLTSYFLDYLVRRSRRAIPGLLSVVVPTYNVEAYLPLLLESLTTQTYKNLEILLVDDGSTDESVSIAEDWAVADSRIQVFRCRHRGNGHARNMGVKRARGEFLAFADADDRVHADAYEVMVSRLQMSGSDFVVGGYERIRNDDRIPVKMSNRLVSVSQNSIGIGAMPAFVDDVFLWNKVFRASFWRKKIRKIPEGIFYEDQEVTAKAFIRARSFDVVDRLVYSWRIRTDGTSITQGKHRIQDLRDRTKVIRDVTAFMSREAPESVQQRWFIRVLGSDLAPYFQLLPQSGPEYWDLLSASVSATLAKAPPSVIAELDAHERLLVLATSAGNRQDVELIVRDGMDNGTSYPLEVIGGEIAAKPSLLQSLNTQVSVDQLFLMPDQVRLQAGVLRVNQVNGHTIVISAYAAIRGLNHVQFPRELAVSLIDSSGTEVPVDTSFLPDDDQIDVELGDPAVSHSHSGFSVVVPEGMWPTKLVISLRCGNFMGSVLAAVPIRPSVKSAAPLSMRVAGFSVSAAMNQISVDLKFAPLVGTDLEKSEFPAVYLATARRTLASSERRLDASAGKATLIFSIAQSRWNNTVLSPESGSYTLRTSYDGVGAGRLGEAVPISIKSAGRLPGEVLTPHASVTPFRTHFGHFAVRLGAPIAAKDRSRYGQRMIRERVLSSSRVLPDTYFFESFGGKSCTDSPRGISDALHDSGHGGSIFWSVTDFSVPVPSYATPVVIGSVDWYRALASASVLVNNHNFPSFFKKKPGQRYVQTWHGTPIKKVGLDAPQHSITPGYRQLIVREAKQWDLLLTQNQFATRKLVSAFAYSGEVLCTGYPRNDALVSPLVERRDQLRSILGIADGQHAVLYAPTWRDDARTTTYQNKLVSYLDFEDAHQRLGDTVVFLLRGHHNVLENRDFALGRNVIDVSEYPQINELFIASDSLVTDYSSVVFDYSLTGKPISLLVPDREQYENHTRGLYIGLDEIAAGNIYTDSASLLSSIKRYQTESEKVDYTNVSKKLKWEFARLDDGHAGKRVIKHLRNADAKRSML